MGIEISTLLFKENYLLNSIAFAFNSNVTLNIIDVISNTFEYSSLLSTLLIIT